MSALPTRPTVAAVIVHDGASYTRQILDGLLQQSLPLQLIAVINTGHSPIYAETRNGVRLEAYSASAEAGYATCVNPVLRRLVKQVDAIWLLDGRPDPYTLQQLWQVCLSEGNCVVSAGVTLYSSLMTRAYRIDRLVGRLVPVGFADDHTLLADPAVDVLSRHGTVIPTTVFQQVGFLDERLHKYWEMADFCLRAKAAGYRLFVHPKARVVVKQTAMAQTAGDVFYMVRNRWWVVRPLQQIWQSAAMMLWDGKVWLGLLLEWLWAVCTGSTNRLNAYEKTRLYWWGVYQGVHPFPPKTD
jgi:GT2 family glycosyltransferase